MMQRAQVILAAMAAPGEHHQFDSVRIQKLLFLIEQEAAPYINGPHFEFKPYRYGPFDRAVFNELSALQDSGLVETRGSHRRAYCLTKSGQDAGAGIVNRLPGTVRQYFEDCARWVLSLSFGNLLSAIYQKYPYMAINSVVPEVRVRYPLALSRSPIPSFLSGVARTLDIGGVFDDYDLANTRERARQQLQEAWRTVGDNLRSTMADFRTTSADADAS